MPTADNVRVAVTGAVYYAPVGTALPTTATAALNAAFYANDVGYLDESGIVQSLSTSTTDIKAWQDSAVVRKIQTSHDLTYKMVMLETASDPLSLYYGNFAGSASVINGTVLDHHSFVFQIDDGGNDIRVVIPDGQITERGDITYANAGAVTYDVTITAFPDGSNNKSYTYFSSEGS